MQCEGLMVLVYKHASADLDVYHSSAKTLPADNSCRGCMMDGNSPHLTGIYTPPSAQHLLSSLDDLM